MKEVIIIKYGELSTKKGNINFFLKKLKNNIDRAIGDYDYSLYYDRSRMIIESNNLDEVYSKLHYVFGIHGFIKGYQFEDDDLDLIKKNILKIIIKENFSTFKVETKRQNKKYPLDSMEVSKELGAYIIKNINNIKVDVHNPELLITVELRTNIVYIYLNEEPGVGVQGRALLLLSGGIDSPVAGYLALKRGVSLDMIYFDSPPHTSVKAKDKVIRLYKELKKYDPRIHLYIAHFTDIQEAILKNIPNNYLITIMRRMMYRISLNLAKKNKYLAIINGESIGQVASQTLTSMSVIDELSKIPIIRPLASFDKLEVISIAKKINTYDISIEPYEDCCTIFVPTHPVINPKSELCFEYEKLIEMDFLLDNITVNIYEEKEEYSDLL